VQEGDWEVCLLESRDILLYQVSSASYTAIPQLKARNIRGWNVRGRNIRATPAPRSFPSPTSSSGSPTGSGVPETVAHMMSLDLRISFDDALDSFYDEQVDSYGREPEVRKYVNEYLGIPQREIKRTGRRARGRCGRKE